MRIERKTTTHCNKYLKLLLGQDRLDSKATTGPIRSARCVSAILDEDVQQVVSDGDGGGGSLAEPEHVPDPPPSSLK